VCLILQGKIGQPLKHADNWRFENCKTQWLVGKLPEFAANSL
jgi:hypothetical protein